MLEIALLTDFFVPNLSQTGGNKNTRFQPLKHPCAVLSPAASQSASGAILEA